MILIGMNEDKPFVVMCSYCQKEFPEVDKQVRAHEREINFSHGICRRHSADMLRQMGKTPEQIASFMQKTDGKTPDLKERSDLLKLYSQGIFTQQQLQQAQNESQKFMARLKELANIHS